MIARGISMCGSEESGAVTPPSLRTPYRRRRCPGGPAVGDRP